MSAGQPLVTLLSDEPARFERALATLDGGVEVSPAGTAYEASALIIDRVEA